MRANALVRVQPKLNASVSSLATPTKSASASTIAAPTASALASTPLSASSKLGKKRPLEEDTTPSPETAGRESRPKRQRVIKEKQ